MSDLTSKEAEALVAVLTLAENHQIWTQRDHSAAFQSWLEEQYAAISEVRALLKRNGILTIHELTQRLAARQEGSSE